MSEEKSAVKFVQQHVFGGEVHEDSAAIEEIEEKDRQRDRAPDGSRRPSAYVTVFENNSRYCLIRMMLLKTGRWCTLSSFEGWKSEVGKDGLLPSILPLCQPISTLLAPPTAPKPTHDTLKALATTDVIDLTLSDDEEGDDSTLEPVPGPSTYSQPSVVKNEDPIDRIIKDSSREDLDLSWFCESDENMTIQELLDRMTVEQLKGLAKQNKCTPTGKGVKKADIVHALLNNASTQGVLDFTPKKDVKGKGRASNPSRQTQLPFGPSRKQNSGTCQQQSQERRLRSQALKILGRCFRVNHAFYRLARRLHVIAFRCTQHPQSLMLEALLTVFKKRTYAEYEHSRDRDIWPSRIELLDYEEALELEMHLDELIDSKPDEATVAREREGTAVSVKARATPSTPGPRSKSKAPPLRSTKSAPSTARATKQPEREPEEEKWFNPEEEEVAEEVPDTFQIQKSKKIVQYLDDWILKRWRLHLDFKMETNAIRTPSLQRFEPGYIYSRMFRKTLKALASLKAYARELELINDMLGQRLFLRGKRAKLYERRAILQTKYLCKTQEGEVDWDVLREALEGVREALLDDDTVLVARPSLLRRLRRLEKRLKVPEEECVVCEGELREAEVVEITAIRIHNPQSSLTKPKNKENINLFFARNTAGSNRSNQPRQEPSPDPAMDLWQRKRKGKSIWQGRDLEEVTVEIRALQYYEDLGFKGFHAETSILTTIFGLLFWDIIFAPVRGAFETKFQSAPLDIVDDSFYYARKELIEARMEEMREGKGIEVLERHYAAHYEKKTWCIGVRWDICTLQDLTEIIESLGGKQLASVCMLFCESYTERCSGVPDLIVWNAQHRICKFVEVKGPGDTPQENQKLWFDSLLAANIDVEICKVIDANGVTSTAASSKKGRSVSSSGGKRKRGTGLTDKQSNSEGGKVDENAISEFEDERPTTLSTHPYKRRRATDPGNLGMVANTTAQ